MISGVVPVFETTISYSTVSPTVATSYAFESGDLYPNPMPSKAALRYLGFDVGQCRLPHAESDDTLDADAAKVVAALQASRG